MFPTLVKFGSFEITTFGLMMFLAFIIGGWVLTRQFRRYGLTDDAASSIVMAAALGGLVRRSDRRPSRLQRLHPGEETRLLHRCGRRVAGIGHRIRPRTHRLFSRRR
jgi:hypothetical protein